MKSAVANHPSRKYCLITPCRNEAQHAQATIESVARQSTPPTLWVIVDDGSSDDTPRLLEEFSRTVSFLTIIRRADRGRRHVGGGVIEAFNEGLSLVDLKDFEFVCKLDLDLVLPPTYFERLIRRMDEDPKLGTCSGKPFYYTNGRKREEVCGDENSVGMIKFYRRRCFEEIGGFVSEVMWDGIDCHRCRMLGWKAASFSDPDLRFEHLRPMGSSQKGIWNGRKRHGEGQYFMGTGPIYLAASALYRIGSRPRFIGSLAMLWGYLSAAVRGTRRYRDNEFVRFLRRYQRRSLLVGKRRAAKEIDEFNEATSLCFHGTQQVAVNHHSDTEELPIENQDNTLQTGASISSGRKFNA